MELFAKIINDQQPLTIFAKSSNLNVWQDSEYICSFHKKYAIFWKVKATSDTIVTDIEHRGNRIPAEHDTIY